MTGTVMCIRKIIRLPLLWVAKKDNKNKLAIIQALLARAIHTASLGHIYLYILVRHSEDICSYKTKTRNINYNDVVISAHTIGSGQRQTLLGLALTHTHTQ